MHQPGDFQYSNIRSALRRAALTAVLGLAVVPALAGAATYTVTQTADTSGGSCTPSACSLRQAFAAAADDDLIQLPASATPYELTHGQLVLTAGATVVGLGISRVVIQANDSDRVMAISGNAATVTLDNLELTGGDTTRPGGGAIAAAGPGPLLLDDVLVTGNTVTPAAGTDQEGGGGVYSIPPLKLIDSSVTDNTVTVADSDGDSGGGGIFETGGDLTLIDSSVTDNTATVTPDVSTSTDNNGGGGIYQDGADLTIKGSTISGNVTTVTSSIVPEPADGGGGIYQFGTNLLLEGSTVAGNVAHGPGVDKGGGGGVFDDGNTSEYVDSTIEGNSTDEASASDHSDGGGGILFDHVGGGAVISDMTIDGNSASAAEGGGINTEIAGTVQVANSIIAANTAGVGGGNCSGPLLDDGYNLADDAVANSCGFRATSPTFDVLTANAGLATLADNGGPSFTQALASGSPAIDAGDPAGCDVLDASVTVDQRGVQRPQGSRCDIGAYERAPATLGAATASVSGTSATLMSSASDPDAQGATASFQYGTTTGYGSTTAAQTLAAGASSTALSAALSGLAPGTYHFRVSATNALGTVVGSDATFTIAQPASTPPPAPSATTAAATAVTATSATLAGTVNPNGSTTTASFDYGTSVVYGSSAGTQSLPGSTLQPITAQLTGLTPSTTYHYRVRAVSAAGTTTATDVTFTTLPQRVAPTGLTARVTPLTGRAPHVYRVTGTVALPSSVSSAVGCAGRVTLLVVAAHKTVASARSTVGSRCRYTITVALYGLRSSSGRASFTVRFGGNGALTGGRVALASASYGARAK